MISCYSEMFRLAAGYLCEGNLHGKAFRPVWKKIHLWQTRTRRWPETVEIQKHYGPGGKKIATRINDTLCNNHGDHLGSQGLATNEANPDVAQQETIYYPFGETVEIQRDAGLHHKFTSQEEDPESGLYYYGARYYDPVIGRFMSADVIVQAPADPQTLNRYSYCRNNPLIYADPTGHFFFIPIIIAAVVSGVIAGIQTNWDLKAVAVSSAIGAVSAGIGMGVGTAVSSALVGLVQSAVVSGAISGAAGGAVADAFAGGANAAYHGSDIGKGTLMGAGIGAASGAAMGALNGYLSSRRGSPEAGSYDNNIPDELSLQRQELSNFNADKYGYTRGVYNPKLDTAGATFYDAQTVDVNGNIEYGPEAFDWPSFQQAVGANESWKLNALYQGQWQMVGDSTLLHRYEIEMAAESWTINNAARLDLTPYVVNIMRPQYNYYADFIKAPHWGQ